MSRLLFHFGSVLPKTKGPQLFLLAVFSAKWYASAGGGSRLTNPKLDTSDCNLKCLIHRTSIATVQMKAKPPVATVTIFDSNLKNMGGVFISLGLVFLPL